MDKGRATVHYNANGGTGNMESQVDVKIDLTNVKTNSFTPPAGMVFKEWNTAANGSGTAIRAEQSMTDLGLAGGDEITLYAIYEHLYSVIYDGNGADEGRNMTNVKHINVRAGDSFDLFASNFSRAGYGFAGWSRVGSAQPGDGNEIYGPNAEFTAPVFPEDTLTLYAVWVPGETGYTLQNFNAVAFEAANPGKTVTALEDQRDNETYAVAKLADGRWWMIENLRLDAEDSGDASLAQGFGGVFVGLANPEFWNSLSLTTANSLYGETNITGNNIAYRIPRYVSLDEFWGFSVTDNRFAAASAHEVNLGSAFSYGNYYNWAAMKANTEDLSDQESSEAAATSICPKGWMLPLGDYGNDYYRLGYALSPTDNSSAGSKIWRSYPNNFIYSGARSSRYVVGSVGSSMQLGTGTVGVMNMARIVALSPTGVIPGTTEVYKNYGLPVRCVLAE